MPDYPTDKPVPKHGVEYPYPNLPCMSCGYTGKVVITFFEATQMGDTEVKLAPVVARCSFCGAEYDPALQEPPPPPDNYAPPRDPPPMRR